MLFKEKKIILKNGTTATFRSPEISDAQNLLDFMKQACAETEFLARAPEEWDMPVEKEEAWVKEKRESPSALVILCLIDGKIAGNCEISFKTGAKTAHRSILGIAILKEYWNLGIGTLMFEELIAAAKAHEGCEIVELGFLEGNDRARHLYEKFGFRVVSQTPNAFRMKDGSLRSEFYMQKYQ